MKKIFSLVLSVILMFSIIPLNISAITRGSIIKVDFKDTYVYKSAKKDGGIYGNYRAGFILTFEDGSTIEYCGSGSEDGIRVDGIRIGYMHHSPSQDIISWEAGNSYQVTGSIMDISGTYTIVSGTYNVEVRENPIKELSIEDFCVLKSNYDNTRYIKGTEYVVYGLSGYSLLYDYNRSCNIQYKDGSSETIYDGTLTEKLNVYYYLETTCIIPPDSWEIGNTYEITATLLGASNTFKVTVLDIKSIEFENVKCFENYDGNMMDYLDENNKYFQNAWFKYNISPNEITVNFSDNSFVSGSLNEISEYIGYNPECYSDQSYENQWGIGNHSATIDLGCFEQIYTVDVVETSIKSISVEDISYIERTNGWESHDPNNRWYEYDIIPKNISITFKDETVVSGVYNEVCEQIGYYGRCSSNQSFENQWDVGEHTAIINLMGFVQEYSISITKSPITSIEIENIDIIEYTQGYEDEGKYIYDYYSPRFSVTFLDGTVESGLSEGITIDEKFYHLYINHWYQYSNPWSVGNTYEVTGSILGVTDTFNVTITESPIQSLEIKDISIVENSAGWDEDGIFYYNLFPDCSISLKDGNVINDNSIEIDGKWYYLEVNTSIQYDEPWKVGNTYEVTGSILGVSDTFNVTIIENPISSIIFDDIKVIENTKGYWDDENECYIYSPIPESFTAILKDGQRIRSSNGIVNIDGESYYVSSYNTNYWSQLENPWKVGKTYQMTGNVFGLSDTFNVTIIESPVSSIKIEDVKCVEGTQGHFTFDDNGGYFCYDFIYIDYSVTLKDGTKLESQWYPEPFGMGLHGVMINGELYDINNIYDNQSISHWGVGTHTAIAEFLGATDEFNITITESPIESIEVEDITLIKDIDSYNDGEFEYYNYSPSYTVFFKDGTEKTIEDGSGITFDRNYYTYLYTHDNQFQNPFIAGETYEVIASFGNITDTFKITIKDTPITNLSIIKTPDKVEYECGEALDLSGAKIVVVFSDGSYRTLNITDDMVSGYNNNKSGIQLLTVNYKGYNTKFAIILNNKFDLNDDGVLNSLDLVKLRKKLLSNDDSFCDVNEDGEMNIKDLVNLKRKIAEII